MLTLFRRLILRARRARNVPWQEAERHARCRESEFCFFNHAATFAFDQVNECECERAAGRPKSG
ncbi:hypothetical protein VSX61_12605 [Brenneria populi subsp. brevivirga]|uniref:hypothetical protein n=1 Tax=Brenneria populi TaxID=1505588 RepID=UPI002E19081A|nr:hypothetical protein [Brenneria populi subsp. brevivirga]